MSTKGLLFIDANQYLDLYRIPSRTKLLPGLEQQRPYIFVTEQIVAEVYRRKVEATLFLVKQELASHDIPLPEHLLSSGDTKLKEIRERLQQMKNDAEGIRKQLSELGSGLLKQVSKSQDEVSKALASIFYQPVKPTDAELERARSRKERGNPPGKLNGPLGDQLCWEQVLRKCREDKPPLWIITNDSDYATKYEGELFLNAALYQDLRAVYGAEPETYCFDSLADGLKHFAATTKVQADKLPTAEETEKIRKEQESLPTLSFFLDGAADLGAFIAARNAFQHDQSMHLAAIRTLSHGLDVFVPLPIKDENKT